MAENKTEKATPKKLEEARKKGQVARSMDLNGAIVLMASLLALSAFGPGMLERMEEATITVLQLTRHPEIVEIQGIGTLFSRVARHVALAAAPVAAVCMIAGVLVNVAQVGIKPMPAGIKPDFKKLNPLTGAKNLFGPNAIAESL
jgi:flagellar biosynthetic protein FlhB